VNAGIRPRDSAPSNPLSNHRRSRLPSSSCPFASQVRHTHARHGSSMSATCGRCIAQTTARTLCINYETDAGRELRVVFTSDNLIHSELSRNGNEPLEARAETCGSRCSSQDGSDSEPPTRRTDHEHDISRTHTPIRSQDLNIRFGVAPQLSSE
jgi:hypothetical protein